MTTKTEDDIRTLIAAAYVAGAEAVHQNWQEDREPDFSEAASDHVASFAETIRTALSAEGERSPNADDDDVVALYSYADVCQAKGLYVEAYGLRSIARRRFNPTTDLAEKQS